MSLSVYVVIVYRSVLVRMCIYLAVCVDVCLYFADGSLFSSQRLTNVSGRDEEGEGRGKGKGRFRRKKYCQKANEERREQKINLFFCLILQLKQIRRGKGRFSFFSVRPSPCLLIWLGVFLSLFIPMIAAERGIAEPKRRREQRRRRKERKR